MTPSAEETDDYIWFVLTERDSSRRRYVDPRNSHTHRGRFSVIAENEAAKYPSRITSRNEIALMSKSAAAWIEGFLAGQEPSIQEFVANTTDDPDEGDERRWHAYCVYLHQEGTAKSLRWLPPGDPALSTLSHPEPWCFVAGRFWIFQEGKWVAINPVEPPSASDWDESWRGPEMTNCRATELHVLSDEILYCVRCHEVVAVLPQ